MDHYLEIRLLPDPEFSTNLLMNELYDRFHRALAEIGSDSIGISFPQAQKTPGDRLRLHGGSSDLQRLMEQVWLKGYMDYLDVSAIKRVPDNCRYRIVRRVQAKSSIERMYRRSVKKGWLTVEQAQGKMAGIKEQRLKQPFVQLKSHSSGQRFRLFIQQGRLLENRRGGKFSAYGLSGEATVPWF